MGGEEGERRLGARCRAKKGARCRVQNGLRGTHHELCPSRTFTGAAHLLRSQIFTLKSSPQLARCQGLLGL